MRVPDVALWISSGAVARRAANAALIAVYSWLAPASAFAQNEAGGPGLTLQGSQGPQGAGRGAAAQGGALGGRPTLTPCGRRRHPPSTANWMMPSGLTRRSSTPSSRKSLSQRPVNGFGVQRDSMIVVTNAQDNPDGDTSSNALYYSGGRLVDDGWTAEMAIPIKSPRYPGRKEGEAHFEVMPTFTTIGSGRLDTATGEFIRDHVEEGGVGVKYGLSSNLTLDFTNNPDFSQIESDNQQIQVNNRFPILMDTISGRSAQSSPKPDFCHGTAATLSRIPS